MDVRIIRSQKRRKTIQARKVGETLEVRVPGNMSDAELEPHVAKLVARMERRTAKAELDDGALENRASELNRRYFEGKLQWQSVRWVTNQNKRYGSCTPARGTIRIAHQLADMPRFVQDYVIVHELAHLLEANHGPKFWALVNRFPKTERARGYLMAIGLEEMDPDP
jgi:predicted metal-dependent hydrolase